MAVDSLAAAPQTRSEAKHNVKNEMATKRIIYASRKRCSERISNYE